MSELLTEQLTQKIISDINNQLQLNYLNLQTTVDLLEAGQSLYCSILTTSSQRNRQGDSAM
ncbi:MAG: hypothetical protein Q4G58_00970 [bacterium]|nr:hypothetical protein [bacterium]